MKKKAKESLRGHEGLVRTGSSKGFKDGKDENIGRSSFANMPQEVIMKPYPKNQLPAGNMLDDTIEGVDEVIQQAERKRTQNVSWQK